MGLKLKITKDFVYLVEYDRKFPKDTDATLIKIRNIDHVDSLYMPLCSTTHSNEEYTVAVYYDCVRVRKNMDIRLRFFECDNVVSQNIVRFKSLWNDM